MTEAMGRPYRTSPVEWQMLSEWGAKIPLHIVLNAITECFSSKKDIRSLNYCKTAVERLFGEWQTAQVGKSDDTEYVYVPEPPCEICGKEICFMLHREERGI